MNEVRILLEHANFHSDISKIFGIICLISIAPLIASMLLKSRHLLLMVGFWVIALSLAVILNNTSFKKNQEAAAICDKIEGCSIQRVLKEMKTQPKKEE